MSHHCDGAKKEKEIVHLTLVIAGCLTSNSILICLACLPEVVGETQRKGAIVDVKGIGVFAGGQIFAQDVAYTPYTCLESPLRRREE